METVRGELVEEGGVGHIVYTGKKLLNFSYHLVSYTYFTYVHIAVSINNTGAAF
jgi:hypothetical protein